MGKSPQILVSWLSKAYAEKKISAAPTKAALHEGSRVVIVASSETRATTLLSGLKYLAKNFATPSQLQHHLDEAMSGRSEDWSYENVESVTHLDEII